MKKELIITVIIVIIIFVTSFITQNYTQSSVSEMNKRLETLKEDVINEAKSNNELNEEIDKIYDIWEDRYKLLTIYIEHTDIEKVNTELKLIKGFIEAKEEKQGVPEIENCLFILDHLKDKQMLTIKNIF